MYLLARRGKVFAFPKKGERSDKFGNARARAPEKFNIGVSYENRGGELIAHENNLTKLVSGRATLPSPIPDARKKACLLSCLFRVKTCANFMCKYR